MFLLNYSYYGTINPPKHPHERTANTPSEACPRCRSRRTPPHKLCSRVRLPPHATTRALPPTSERPPSRSRIRTASRADEGCLASTCSGAKRSPRTRRPCTKAGTTSQRVARIPRHMRNRPKPPRKNYPRGDAAPAQKDPILA